MIGLMIGQNSWNGMTAATWEGTVFSRERFVRCEEQELTSAAEWLLSPVCGFLLLPTGPFYLLVFALSIWEPRDSLLESSSPYASRGSYLYCCCLALFPGWPCCQNTVTWHLPPGLLTSGRTESLRRVTLKDISDSEEYRTALLQSLFLKQTCLLQWFFSVLTV
jgi:hypothetical protein